MKNQKGFTVLELLIATTVLAVILVMATLLITSISNLYYKGVNESKVQGNARAIDAQMTQDLQFSNDAPRVGTDSSNSDIHVICIGDVRYSFVKLIRVGDTLNGKTYAHVLWRESGINNCSQTAGADLTTSSTLTGGTEMISGSSRITALTVTQTDPAQLTIGVAFGDDNLLNLSASPVVCKGGTDDKFCGTANISSTVVKRL
jgi:prepilin-type N-terminal cleavage/methylation domain-containing protein